MTEEQSVSVSTPGGNSPQSYPRRVTWRRSLRRATTERRFQPSKEVPRPFRALLEMFFAGGRKEVAA